MSTYQSRQLDRVPGPKPRILLRPDLAAYFVPRQRPAGIERSPQCRSGVLAQLAEGGSWE